MKIIFTIDTIHRGGKERQLFLLTKSLIDKNYYVKIISKKYSENNYLEEYNISAENIILLKYNTFFTNYIIFKQIVKSEKPDIIISWDLVTFIYALVCSKRYKIKFINASIQHGIRLFRISHIVRSIICMLSPYVIANSFAGLKANNLKPGERRFVLYNGIELKFINNLSKPDIEILRNRLILQYNQNPGIVYISVANFVPYKDYFTVLKALSKLKSDFNFYYIIVGDGPMRQEIKKKIVEYNLENNVILTGKTENVREYLFSSDIMIHSSRGEGISNAILEGMYAGLPVIATKVGGIPETVFPGSSLLFPYKDDDALYKCLLKSYELKNSFNPESEEYKTHLKKFSADKMVKRFEEILESVMKEKD